MVSSRPENRRNNLYLGDAKDVYCRRVLDLRFLLNFFVHLPHTGFTMTLTEAINGIMNVFSVPADVVGDTHALILHAVETMEEQTGEAFEAAYWDARDAAFRAGKLPTQSQVLRSLDDISSADVIARLWELYSDNL